MKTRESGMPPEELWQRFFDPADALRRLGLTPEADCVVDFGCGYGTFSIPAAQLVRGTVHAIDLDPEMLAATRGKAAAHKLPNVVVTERDFVEQGCGLADEAADYVMLFNILHASEARVLLAEAKRILRSAGKLGVMHWNYDPATPRGPSMQIRWRPEECQRLVEQAGFEVSALIPLPPYHYGFTARRAD